MIDKSPKKKNERTKNKQAITKCGIKIADRQINKQQQLYKDERKQNTQYLNNLFTFVEISRRHSHTSAFIRLLTAVI